MKKITDLSDVEIEEIYRKFFYRDEETDEVYIYRAGYGSVEIGQDSDIGMGVTITDNGSIYLYCNDNGEIYDGEEIAELIKYLKIIGIYPFT